MPYNRNEAQTTEEIRAINDIDLVSTTSIKNNKYKVPFLILLISFIVLLSAVSINYIRGGVSSNTDNEKDEAFRYAWESDVLRFEYEGKDLTMENSEDIFTLFNSESWIKGGSVSEEEIPEFRLKLANDYYIDFHNEVAVIYKNGAKTTYKINKNITLAICGYIEENTYISVDDMSSLLSVSENLTLVINGISCTTSKGQTIANALNTSTWVEISGFTPETEPFLTISDPIGLTVKIYDTANIAVISYKGNSRCYEIDELAPASVALAAQTAFNAEALKIESSMENCDDLIVVLNGNSFRIDANTAWSKALAFNTWTRRYKLPAAIPENSNITIFDDISFVLKIYEDLLVAEYDNSYYNISESVISSIKSYLTVTPPEKEDIVIKKFEISEFVPQITKQQHLHSDFSGKSTLTSINNDIISALSINAWTKTSYESDTFNVVLTTDSDVKDGGFIIAINTATRMACIEWNGMIQNYRTSADIASITKYIQDNVYTELWQISATELGTLQNSATSIETVITKEGSEKDYLSSESIGVSDIIKVSASLNLTPVETKPEMIGSQKIEMTFKNDANKFLITYYNDSENRFIVSVSGTLSDIGKRIDRNFVADGGDYNKFLESLNNLIERNYDIVAGTFIEAIKSMDSIALNNLTGNIFDYGNISNVKFNTIAFEKTEELGIYRIKFDVADPADGPFKEGESFYILVIGSTDGSLNLKVRSLTEEHKYDVSKLSHDAISFANDFASWYKAEDLYFNKFNEVKSKKSAVDFLMLLALREGLNQVHENDPTGIYFTPEVISKMAVKYFNSPEFDAKDTSAYNEELNLFVYTAQVVPVDIKNVVSFTENLAENKYQVTITWYEDPLYLYETKTVVYTLDKSGEGTYRILSATAPKHIEEPTDNSNNEDAETPEEPIPSEDEGLEENAD